jgi:hypothetical protein
MGVRGEIFSNRVILPNRTYFFIIKENRMGDLYLNIVESKNRETGGFDRQSVVLFADDLQDFLKGFDESLRVMEKAVREKKQSGGVSTKHGGEPSKRDEQDGYPKQQREYENNNSRMKQRRPFGNDRERQPRQRSDFDGGKDRYPRQRNDFNGRRDGRTGQRNNFNGERDGLSGQRNDFNGGKDGRPKQRKDFGAGKEERKFRERKNDRRSPKDKRVIVRKHEK